MTKWLSTEWFDQTRSMVADHPERPGLSARIRHDITGGPDGEVSCYWVLEDGRVVDSGPGTIDRPDVTLTLGWADAVAVHGGHLDPNVAFMQGRMKVDGSMAVLVTLLVTVDTPECLDLRRRIAEVTEF